MGIHSDAALYPAAPFQLPQSRLQSPRRKPLRPSYSKYVVRQVTRAWKRVTVGARKPERASVLPDGFILITARRRSMFLA